MSTQLKLQNWTKVAGAKGLYVRSHAGAQPKNEPSSQGEQERTAVVLKTLEKRMSVILQAISKR